MRDHRRHRPALPLSFSLLTGALSTGLRPVLVAVVLSAAPMLDIQASAAAIYGAGAPSSARTGQIESICRDVVGLQWGSGQHDFCVKSLSESYTAYGQSAALLEARRICLAQSRSDGSTLAECELALAPTVAVPSLAIGGEDGSSHVSSFFHATPADVHGREERACARLGLDAVSDAFAQCVANLDASLDTLRWSGGG